MKALFFDFDGTIFDSPPYWEAVLQETLLERSILSPGVIFTITKTLGVARAADWMVEEFPIDEKAGELAESWRKKMKKNYELFIPIKENVKEFFQSIEGKNLILCLATAMDRDYVEKALEREGILDVFDYIITTPELNCDKRGPEIYLHCADHFSLTPGECMVFEDALDAVTACKGAGFKVTGIYDGIAREEFEKMKEICDYSFEIFPGSLEYAL